MTEMTRRDFLSTASLSAAWPLAGYIDRAWRAGPAQPTSRPVVIFDEPGFPVIDAGPLPAIPNATTTTTVAALVDALRLNPVLVWRHGSVFPAEAWEAILRFLENGGALFYAGGEPFTRSAYGSSGRRQVEPRTLSYLQALRLNQSYRLDAGGATIHRAGAVDRQLPSGAWINALEPRFSDTTNFPTESGSPGTRDALLRPLAYAHRAGDDRRFPFGAVAYAIDRLRGPFAGGRWVFWLASSPPDETEWTWLLGESMRPAIDFRADPTFGCFHDGETPSLILRAHRPRATDAVSTECTIRIESSGVAPRSIRTELSSTEHGTSRVALAGTFAPGLHRVTVDGGILGQATTGFWIFDDALFKSGDTLTFDEYTMRRNGRPAPVVGTTSMSATVHRDFLFEPNAAVWDDTFAELASLGVNMVRTGLWSGWRKVSLEPNVVDEGVLRATEALYLTARKHGIPIIFNVFAFVPELYGGSDPYLDPRALEGQRALLGALAGRMAPARELIWDLINEPSFDAPNRLWSLRPSGSNAERRAFTEWLASRYQPASAEAGAGAWQDVVRRRWRLRPDEPIGLPRDEDFADPWVIGTRRPFRALDFALFAQETFERWIGEMRAAIRSSGSQGAITVGQDEAGLGTSPSALFHHKAVEFTCMHTWWNDDALLWDGVLSKASGSPLLIGETGIMQRQRLSSEAVRSPEDFAALLSRKIGYAFAAGAFGVVQWCYETNPYIDSDNEAAIGLKRVDGSVKPEHKVLADAAAFVARNRNRFEGWVAPDIALVVPTAEQFSPRPSSVTATRAAVRACYEQLSVPLRAVADHRASRDLGQPKAILLPACRSISAEGWAAITTAVEKGATLVCSGWFETDDAELPAVRLGVGSRPLRMVETMSTVDGGRTETWRFPGTTPESWYAANTQAPRRLSRGAGTIVHHPLPIEWAEPTDALARFYGAAFGETLAAPRIVIEGTSIAGVTVVPIVFRDAWLLVAINESSHDGHVVVGRPGQSARVAIDVPGVRARLAFVDSTRWTLLDMSA